MEKPFQKLEELFYWEAGWCINALIFSILSCYLFNVSDVLIVLVFRATRYLELIVWGENWMRESLSSWRNLFLYLFSTRKDLSTQLAVVKEMGDDKNVSLVYYGKDICRIV